MYDYSRAVSDDWIDTVSGPFWPSMPAPADVHIQAIAHALANLCRFGGHSREFYSVAQHSVLCARQVPYTHPRLKLAALLHDAAEAYVVDLPRPLKAMLPDYRHMESQVEAAIAAKFNLMRPLPDLVRQIDNRMLVTEAAQLMTGASGQWWRGPGYPEPFTLVIEPWPPEAARAAFLGEFNALQPKREASPG